MSKITKMEIQKKNKNRFNIFIDEEYAMSLSLETVYIENLQKDMVVDLEKLKILAEKESHLRCKEDAIKIVERSYKTEKQIIEKLQLKGYGEEPILKSMNFLKEYGFVNDGSYAENFINEKIKTKGRQKIKYDLIRKGISRELIEEKISEIDIDKEKINALNLAKKKLRIICKSDTDKYKINEKLYRYLISKGYSYDIVKNVVREVLELDYFE